MSDIKSANIKRNKKNININESFKENKYSNINEAQIITKNINYNFPKNNKAYFINNKNHINSINIIKNNANYKNIILNNMITPNKKIVLNSKTTSMDTKNIKIEGNIIFNNDQNEKRFRTLSQNKQKSLNKNSCLKLLLNDQEQNGININVNDIEGKYKLILYEKNNLINKLKNEVEYYKNQYNNINMNMNIIMPNSNNTIETNSNNRLPLGLKAKNNIDRENIRSKIKNIFSLPKKENKINNNNLLQYNINDHKTIKTFINKSINDSANYSNENSKVYVPLIKNNFNTISDHKTINYIENNLLLSNDNINNEVRVNENNNNINLNLNSIMNISNSNNIHKREKKLKLGFHRTDLNLNMNNNNKYDNIVVNRNNGNSNKNKKHIIYSLNIINSNSGSDNDFDINKNGNNKTIDVEENIKRRRFLNKNIFNKLTSSPSTLHKNNKNKKLIDFNNSEEEEVIMKNVNEKKEFNYRENFDKLKQRMNGLINNLFELIDVQNKK